MKILQRIIDSRLAEYLFSLLALTALWGAIIGAAVLLPSGSAGVYRSAVDK